MIKTLNINLGGVVFQIDEDAYGELSRYIDSLNQYYRNTEGREEIVADIEQRLAELLGDALEKSGFRVVSMADVTEVIDIMGRPEDFEAGEEAFEEPSGYAEPSVREGASGTRRLYRDMDSGIIAGVSAGLAAYWGVKDPIWIRIAFILVAIFSAGMVALIIYVLLWILIPEAVTNAQKLEMRGEPVNISNLERKIREDLNRAGENLKNFATSDKSRSALHSLVDAFGRMLGVIVKVAYVFLKVVLAIVFVAIVIALVASLFTVIISLIVALPSAVKYIFAGPVIALVAIVGALLVIGIPLIYLIYLPFRVIGKRRLRNRQAGLATLGAFIVGVILSFAAASVTTSYFSQSNGYSYREAVPLPAGDTLWLAINENEADFERLEHKMNLRSLLIFTKKLETASDRVELDIVPSSDGNIYLERIFRSSGRSREAARQNAEAITYQVRTEGNRMIFDPIFGLGDKRKWRNQTVRLRLELPEGLAVIPERELGAFLDDADNTAGAGPYTVAGNRWVMTGGMLEPIDSALHTGSTWARSQMKRIPVQPFDRLEIDGDVDVEIVHGTVAEVYLAASEGQEEELDFDHSGNTLRIERHGGKWNVSIGFLGNKGAIDPKIYISLPKLDFLDAGGQAYVTLEGWPQDAFSVNTTAQAVVDIKGADVADLKADLSGQSHLEIEGRAARFQLQCSAQSNFDGVGFEAGELFVELHGQSDAEMHVVELIEGSLHAQSDLDYWGNPEVKVTTHAQSDISKRTD